MAMSNDRNTFEVLSKIDVKGHVEKKNGLSYLSWSWAWGMLKKVYPDSNYKIYETPDNINYFTDGRTCWVKTGVIVEGLEHIEELPVMNNYNKSIPLEQVTSMDVNKSIQRSLTKAIARHGLGFSVYAGEDLPDDVSQPTSAPTPAPKPKKKLTAAAFDRMVKAAADGKTVDGVAIRDWYVREYAPTEADLARFDSAVEVIRTAVAAAEKDREGRQ